MASDDVVELVEVDELQSLYELTDRLYRAQSLDDVFEAGLDAITGTLGCTKASILIFDDEGVMRFRAARGLSAGYRRLLEGHTPWQAGEQSPSPILVSDIDETDEADWVKRTIMSEGIRSLAFVPLTVGGGVVGKFMSYYPGRRTFSPHEVDLAVMIARQVGFAVERERSEDLRRRAEAELHHSEARFRLMSEDAPVMIWMSDSSGACLHLNRALRNAWGVSEADVPKFDWRSTMHPDDAQRIVEAVSAAAAARTELVVKGRYRVVDGTYRTFETTARPHRSASGEYLGMIGVNVDVTEREEASAHRELIFNEMNHRVKNTLAVVQAIAHQTLKGSESADKSKAFIERLASLATAHNLLTQANWENAPLRQLISDALMIRGRRPERISLAGPDVYLAPKQALAVAMAMHELNTNAWKYGALSVEGGMVGVSWELADGILEMIWQESGGPSALPPVKRGFGTFMLEQVLANDLGGSVTLEFLPGGIRCEIRAPLARGVA